MTPEQHKERHAKLHQALDELIADWLVATQSLPSGSSVMELMQWSGKQTREPDHEIEQTWLVPPASAHETET